MKFELIHPDAKLPTRGSPYAAGLDLYTIDYFEIPPGRTVILQLGICSEIPRGWVGLIRDRSSLGAKGIVTAAGVIDADYRGEWKVVLRNVNSFGSYVGLKGDRIAQVVIVQHYVDPPQQVEFLKLTKRSTGGFGSTGK